MTKSINFGKKSRPTSSYLKSKHFMNSSRASGLNLPTSKKYKALRKS